MNEIGFRNFRRFKELKSLPLGGINLFVGGNNAGKSTVVKGVLLLLDFLKNQKISNSNLFETSKFRFDGPGANDVNIDTFGRALCWKAKEKEIVFNAAIEEFFVEVCIYSNSPKEEGYADVKYIKLEDQKTDLKFVFDVANGKVLVSSYIEQRMEIQKRIEELEMELKRTKVDLDRMSELELNEEIGNKMLDRIAQKSHIEAALKELRKNLESEGIEIEMRLQQSLSSSGYSYVYSYLQGLLEFVEVYAKSKKSGKTEIGQKDLAWLEQHLSDFNDICNRFEHAVQKISVEYLYSHNANQRVIYNKKDENDYVSKSIYEIYNQRITSESEIGKIMLSWLNDFCSIDDYKIESVQGVAYRFTLKFDGKWIDLADMGRGTIQLVILFVRLASIIKKYQGKTEAPIVLVEEPEQNLHPAFQSKLTDLLCQVYDEFNIRFIIETHSEYLIRRAQVLVAQANYDEETLKTNNPFKVYYFPVDNNPYDMVFTSTGHFKNPFGTGFLDEAGKSALTISRIERDRNKALL